MILYHGITLFHLLWIVVHKFNNYKNQKCVLILAEYMEKKLTNTQIKLLKQDFEIYFFPYSQITNDCNDICEKTLSLYSLNIPYGINEFEEIFMAGYHYYFFYVMLENKIEFNIIEEAVGMLSNTEVLKEIVYSLNPKQYDVAVSENMFYSENILIKHKYCSLNHQKSGFIDEKAIDFKLIEVFQRIDNKSKKEIMDIFLVPQLPYSCENDTILLLSQNFSNLKIMTFEQQVLIYQLFVDYFVNNKNLLIKTHPNDIMYYSLLFPQAKIIKEKFPSEFLPFIFEKVPDTVATISSTAIFSIANSFKNKIEFSTDYEKDFFKTNKYYFALRMFDNDKKLKTIQLLGCNEQLVKNLIMFSDLNNQKLRYHVISNPSCINPHEYLIVDDCTNLINEYPDFDIFNVLEMQNKNDKVVFLNSKKDYMFYLNFNKTVWEDITPIVLTKKIIKEDEVYIDNNEEAIYLYCKGRVNRAMINEMGITKTLPNTGCEIEKQVLTKEQERIKILEGILDATEKRLLFYIEKEKVLVEELNKYRK